MLARSSRVASTGERLLAAVLLASVLLSPRLATAARGGPDTFGYTWRDSAEPGVAYAWEDITTTGVDITMAADDQNSGFRALSFGVPYYGRTYTQIGVCTNGFVSLVDGGAIDYGNVALPTAGPPAGTIAAFWDDFNLTGGGQIWYQDFSNRVVVTWVDVPYYDDTTLHATFQVIVFADGHIVAQLQNIGGPDASETIGIEKPDDTDGLTAWFATPVPRTSYAVEFDPPTPITVSLDCSRATPLTCGADIAGDLARGVANQDRYRCVLGDMSGREQVYVATLATPTTVRFVMEPLTGSPTLIMLDACDPNSCSAVPGGLVSLANAVGTYTFVVDCPPGQEGMYTMREDCLPLVTSLDCAAPPSLGCGVTVAGDLAAGTASQDSYWCSLADYSGREQVWLVDFPVLLPSATFTLTATSGNPDLVVLYPCDADACLGPPGDTLTISNAIGQYYAVVDCARGDEGGYQLAVTGGAAPTRSVGNALRATAHGTDTVDFDWSLAVTPRASEHYVVMRSDDAPGGPFTLSTATRSQAWTDPAATPRFSPSHVWYYSVFLADSCGNLSAD